MMKPGRSCPLHYRYRPEALTVAPALRAETLYVVGGLYGNLEALAALEALIESEPDGAELVFNGDFNWFDVAAEDFAQLNRRVLAHTAIQGNVEAELCDPSGAGCGCAYPDTVDAAVVQRSNRIMARLRDTARAFPQIQARLSELPLHLTAEVGGLRLGIVHGDADSLAGWSFDANELSGADDDARLAFYADKFRRAGVRIFASSHTCSPCAQRFLVDGQSCALINNGAAGMPSFAGDLRGLITRISTRPAPVATRYGTELDGVFVHAVPLAYDNAAWQRRFLAQWPPGSPAHESYFGRIARGADLHPRQAARGGFRLTDRSYADVV
jgi:hypothetical protein